MNTEKHILITGTRKGIGRYLAEYYLAQGYQVIGLSRQASNLEAPNYRHFLVDIVEEKQVKDFFLKISKDYKKLDILINNAAINPSLSPALLVPSEVAFKTFQVNTLGVFMICREATKLMMKNKFGRIINMGSMAVHHEVAGEAIYTASKAAVSSFTKVFAKEIYSYGITCNIVAPSVIKTDLSDHINPEALQEVLKRNAIPTFGNLSDISHTIDWLIRPESTAITGQVIYLGGV